MNSMTAHAYGDTLAGREADALAQARAFFPEGTRLTLGDIHATPSTAHKANPEGRKYATTVTVTAVIPESRPYAELPFWKRVVIVARRP